MVEVGVDGAAGWALLARTPCGKPRLMFVALAPVGGAPRDLPNFFEGTP